NSGYPVEIGVRRIWHLFSKLTSFMKIGPDTSDPNFPVSSPRWTALEEIMLKRIGLWILISAIACSSAAATEQEATRAEILRGEYGPYRANNDLLFYHLDIRVDPEKKFIGGKNTIRFKMLNDDTRIQLDLVSTLNVDKIMLGSTALKFERV